MKSIRIFTLLIFSFLFTIGFAQEGLDKFAPVDPEIRSGKLDNGLTYYIRKNKEPEKRASFYIIQNVGAILENDNQNGLAHFLEHMAFNGTKNFPGKAIISSLEKHGVAFGYNINAYTSFDETVYNLSGVPVEAPGLVDSCLLILHDWSDYITLAEKEIDLERGVISEEYRTTKNASRRMIFEVLPVVLKGSKYAVRDIIGSLDIINNFTYNTLRSFYHDWYRTDLQAIVVVGDINVDEVENKIRTLFSKIEAVKNPFPRLAEEVPFHADTRFVIAKDKEAPSTSVSVISLHKAVPREKKDMNYLRENHVISLMNSMINTRISERLQKENPPFVNGNVSYGAYYARGYDAFTITAIARRNEEDIALKAIYEEADRARRFGFTPGELERAKARTLANYENMYKQRDKIDNDTYAAAIQEYYLNNEPLTSMEFDFEFLKTIISGITPEETSAKFREKMIDENRTIIIQGLDGDDIKHLTQQEALDIISKIKNTSLTPYTEEAVASSLITSDIKGSAVVSEVLLPEFDAVEWTLGNKAKVVFRKADFEKDNVMLSAFSYGGSSKLPASDVLAAAILPTVTQMYGVGEFDNITLQKMLSGKKATVNFSLSETTESISATCTPKDFETMMQLVWLKFEQPRFEKGAHDALITRLAAQVANMEKDPDKIKSDSLSLIASNYSPRTPVINKANIEAITIDEIEKIYTDRFTGADEFIFFIVGNIDQDSAKKMAEKYIGAIKTTNREETWIDHNVHQPAGGVTKEISLPLTIPKSTVALSFETDMKFNPYNNLGLSVINGILDIVFVEKIRENEGGTYSVGVQLGNQKRPSETAEGIITFDCDPARANELKAIVYRELDILMKKGSSQENLDKAVNNILKNREESKLHNTYWMTALTRYYQYGINNDDPANYEDILKSYKIKDIKKIATAMFKKANVVDLIFKPAL